MEIEIIIVVAHGKNRVIGKDNKLLWRLPKDMEFFKNLTITKPESAVFSGRKTFESVPRKFRPLTQRWNFINSRNPNYTPEPTNEKTKVFSSLGTAVQYAKEMGIKKIFIIGGGEIYKEALSQNSFFISKIIATEIDAEFEGDTYFPDFDKRQWESTVLEESLADEKNPYDFKIIEYKRQFAF